MSGCATRRATRITANAAAGRRSASTPPPPRSPSPTTDRLRPRSASQHVRQAQRRRRRADRDPAPRRRRVAGARDAPRGHRARRRDPRRPARARHVRAARDRSDAVGNTRDHDACVRTGARWSLDLPLRGDTTLSASLSPPRRRAGRRAPERSGSAIASARGCAACCDRAARCCRTRACGVDTRRRDRRRLAAADRARHRRKRAYRLRLPRGVSREVRVHFPGNRSLQPATDVVKLLVRGLGDAWAPAAPAAARRHDHVPRPRRPLPRAAARGREADPDPVPRRPPVAAGGEAGPHGPARPLRDQVPLPPDQPPDADLLPDPRAGRGRLAVRDGRLAAANRVRQTLSRTRCARKAAHSLRRSSTVAHVLSLTSGPRRPLYGLEEHGQRTIRASTSAGSRRPARPSTRRAATASIAEPSAGLLRMGSRRRRRRRRARARAPDGRLGLRAPGRRLPAIRADRSSPRPAATASHFSARRSTRGCGASSAV